MPSPLRLALIAVTSGLAAFLALRPFAPPHSAPPADHTAPHPDKSAPSQPTPHRASAADVPTPPPTDPVLLKRLAKTDPDLARALLRLHGATDPARGADLALALEDAGLPHAVLEFLRGWISADAGSAWRWVAQRNGFKSSHLGLIADTLARGQPLALADALSTPPAGNVKSMLTAELAKAWFSADRAAASAWIDSLRSSADQRALDAALGGYLAGWAAQAPRDAATWAVGQLPSGPLRREGLAAAMQAWLAKGGAPDAAAWLEAQPSSPDFQTASLQLSRAWIESSPADAIKWAKRTSDLVAADTALSAGARHYASSNPATAVRFAEEMSPGKMRETALRRVVTQWKASDPTGLETYLRSQNRLLPAERDAALQQLPPR